MKTDIPTETSRCERPLRFLLLALALAEFGAVLGILMPVSWMAAIHEWIALGPMPNGPLVPYLARSLSAFYVIHGGVVFVCARNIRRFAPLILYLAWSGIAFAALVTYLDLQSGFPWYWMLAEGPGLAVLSVVILVLLRRVPCPADPVSRKEDRA